MRWVIEISYFVEVRSINIVIDEAAYYVYD